MVKAWFRHRLRLGQQGVLHLPFLGALLVVLVAGLGLWGALRDWRHQVQTQLRLDRCAADTAWEMKKALLRLRKTNQWIQATRLTIAAARVAPPALVALRIALETEVIGQEMLRKDWEVRRGLWLARGGCGAGARDRILPLPGIPVIRPLPDSIGPKPLLWTGEVSAEFRIELAHGNRAAAAEVGRGEERSRDIGKLKGGIENAGLGGTEIPSGWVAVWRPPRIGRLYAGSGLH